MYRRNLPHWRIPGSMYFVTFHLADSIPRAVLDEWRYDRGVWLSARGISSSLPRAEQRRRYETIPETERTAFEREATRRFFSELDIGHGTCELRHPDAASIVADALRFHDGTRLQCGDFVVMPNHVHWLLKPQGEETLERLLQSVKQFSCKRINARFNRTGTLWQKESHDHVVRDAEELARIRKYIAENSAKARLGPDEYVYHQAFDVGPIS